MTKRKSDEANMWEKLIIHGIVETDKAQVYCEVCDAETRDLCVCETEDD
jgi:hypothetical protein